MLEGGGFEGDNGLPSVATDQHLQSSSHHLVYLRPCVQMITRSLNEPCPSSLAGLDIVGHVFTALLASSLSKPLATRPRKELRPASHPEAYLQAVCRCTKTIRWLPGEVLACLALASRPGPHFRRTGATLYIGDGIVID